MPKLTLKLTPMVRWMMSFGAQAERFKDAYNAETIKLLSQRYMTAEDRVRSMALSTARIDLFLFLTLYSTKLPNVQVFGQSVSDLAFLSEFLLVASALSFVYLASAFTTARAYEAMVGALADRHQPQLTGWNGHFYKSALVDQELSLHVASQRLHTHPEVKDDWSGGVKMNRLENSYKTMVLVAAAPILLLHFGVTVWSAVVLPQRANVGLWLDVVIVTFAVIVNLAGIVIFYLTHFREQDFEHSDIST